MSKWNDHLFLSINRYAGRHPGVDFVMIFCADYLLFILGIVSVAWAFEIGRGYHYLFLFLGSATVSYISSWTIGLLFPHRRPIRSLPHVRQLITPLSTWKSFPSDHTIGSVVIVQTAIANGAPHVLVVWLSVGALFVGLGRVFVGVHYPRDIVGGIVVGSISSLAVILFLAHFGYPLYPFHI